jgi:hypothetical protein
MNDLRLEGRADELNDAINDFPTEALILELRERGYRVRRTESENREED